MMRVIIERCCGLDVHQETVVACLLIGAPGDRPTKEVRTFRTVTRERVPKRPSLERLGRRLSRQPRERRPAEERPRPKGQCPPPHDPGRRRNLRREDRAATSKTYSTVSR